MHALRHHLGCPDKEKGPTCCLGDSPPPAHALHPPPVRPILAHSHLRDPLDKLLARVDGDTEPGAPTHLAGGGWALVCGGVGGGSDPHHSPEHDPNITLAFDPEPDLWQRMGTSQPRLSTAIKLVVQS